MARSRAQRFPKKYYKAWKKDDLYCLPCESYVKPERNWVRKVWICPLCRRLIAR
jgi:hypothetical protein